MFSILSHDEQSRLDSSAYENSGKLEICHSHQEKENTKHKLHNFHLARKNDCRNILDDVTNRLFILMLRKICNREETDY